MSMIAYPTDLSGGQEGYTGGATPPRTEFASASSIAASSQFLKRGLLLSTGAISFTRYDLEEYLAQGKMRNIYILGSCSFADDIPPDLVERAVASFHLKGKLNASDAVRAVLKRKGGEVSKKNG